MRLEGKRALITGVTGTVAGPVGVRLKEAGMHVRALIRKPEQAPRAESLGLASVVGDLLDKTSLATALEDVQLVVHCAVYLGHDAELARKTNVDGVLDLAKLALAAGVERFVHISTLIAYGTLVVFGMFDGKEEIDESYALLADDAMDAPYPITKAQGERALASVAAEGLATVVLRPGAVGGEINSRWGDESVQRIAQVDSMGIFHPGDLVAWIHVENLADMVALVATEDAAIGEAYHAVDGNFHVFESVSRIAAALGKPVEIPERPPMNPVFRHDKIAQLGYRPRRSWNENVEALERMARELKPS